MKELTIEQKAKAYDEAKKVIKDNLDALNEITETGAEVVNIQSIKNCFCRAFPELTKSKDEKIRQKFIKLVKMSNEVGGFALHKWEADEMLAWLEKQNSNVDNANKEYWRGYREGKQEILDKYAELEKQGEQEQLYIRFGEIPTDEKSKIFQGEIEVGTENGVSAYPAFKTSEGDIVLGLSLPITKTTLYTQQHLIEYDDRPCYLVKGDYVGKDTDGQPLINNVSIIEKIDTYRVKEEKQGEQEPTDKVEPKFKVGDYIKHNKANIICKIISVNSGSYYVENIETSGRIELFNAEQNFHLWTIEDAKDGDVLCYKDEISLYKHDIKNCTKQETTFGGFVYHCCYDGKRFIMDSLYSLTEQDKIDIHPATKEQRDILFQKMREASYEWDAEKKELKTVEKKPQRVVSAEAKEALYDKPTDNDMVEALRTEYEKGRADAIAEMEKPTWSVEDMSKVQRICEYLDEAKKYYADITEVRECINWLKSLKQRIGGKV